MTIRLLLAVVALHGNGGASGRSSRSTSTQATIQQLSAAMDAGTLTSERLVQLGLARIEAYDEKGPLLNAVLTLNPKALDTARALDAERKAKGKRSLLHGIPIVLKDNFDTADLPTTGGSILLDGSIPPDDAFVVKKLRDAGAVIVAKVNLSEFASGGAFSSLGGQTRNPHDPTRTPSGSSGGTGVSIAAGYAVLGLGTDTGGSVRGPSTSNGIVGLKPTHGLLSRDGIIPLALTFDTGGPMARSVADVAVALGIMTGVDPADEATKKSEGRFERDYTKYLNADGLKGARIGIARDFMAQDAEVDWVVEASLQALRAGGATVVDVRFPKWLLDVKGEFYTAVRYPEFPAQVATYLATLKPGFPRTHRRDDRALRPDRGDAARRRRPESAALEPLQARGGERSDRQLPLHRRPRSRAAAGAGHRGRGDDRRQPRRPGLPDRLAAAGVHQRAAGHPGRRRRVGLQPRQPHRLSRPDRPGRLHQRPAAGGDLVRRPGLQRAEAAPAGLCVRAGDQGAAAAGAHARPCPASR